MEAQRTAWHTLERAEVLERVGATEAGLGSQEAAARLASGGRNVLPHSPPPAWWQLLLRQVRSPIILILIVAAAVSLAIGHGTDALIIGLVVVVNALLGGFQEYRAERSALALRQLLRTRAFVVRDGEEVEIDAEEVVPGDVVALESGYRVPADARLLHAHGLEIDESLLTGESLAVLKEAGWSGGEGAPVADRRSMVFAGSIVSRGRGLAVVVGTGAQTEVGRLARDVMGGAPGHPPLLLRMARFTKFIGIAAIIAAALVGVLGVLVQGYEVFEMFLFAVAVAVSAIPEGLPVAITVALAISSTRMSRRKVIVRRLHAVEGLGSCTLIASDKTGTLTCNELTVREVRPSGGGALEVTGVGFAPEGEVVGPGGRVGASEGELRELALVSVLCNEASLYQRDGRWGWRGDPTDVALLALAEKLGVDREQCELSHPQVNQIPFEPEHRFAATFHADGEGTLACVKGATERVLEMCDFEDAEHRGRAASAAQEMAGRGLRVLALASGRLERRVGEGESPPRPEGLALHGLVGMIDPLREGVREAVCAAQRAGVAVSMVTGDHPVTALAIARDLGMADSPEEVLTGGEIERLDEAELSRRVGTVRVFARVAPSQKLDIVKAAQRAGHFVAVTGDGVNDAPALRAANIGVSMGRSGTDVAREASDLVVSDDNFASIVGGIEEGRVAYDNIRKVIYLLVSTGGAEVILIALAIATASPLPLLPAQILWLNLVTNGIQDKALAFEPDEGDALRRPPRDPKERIFNRVMIHNTVWAALVLGVGGFLTFRWLLAQGWEEAEARNGLLLLMVLFENVHLGNCRSETKLVVRLSPLRNPVLLAAAVSALLLHVLMMYVPFGQKLLGVAPVPLETWLTFGVIAVVAFWLIELNKLWWRKHDPRPQAPAAE